jgi:archaellum component FlaC
MMSVKQLSETVESLEKRMEEMQDSFRRFAQEDQQILATLSKIGDELAGVRAELKGVKADADKKAQQFTSKKF